MKTLFSAIRTVAHNLKITAILKLLKLALRPLLAMTTQPPGQRGMMETGR